MTAEAAIGPARPPSGGRQRYPTLSLGSGSGTAQSAAVRTAPGFTLPSTSGNDVSLASYRGHDVVLYFSEGVGCDACFYQMTEFQNHAAELASAGITIIPIVMNPAAQVRQEMAAFGIRTPFLWAWPAPGTLSEIATTW